ncbi:MAG: hypothetical protein ACTHPD_16505 [Rhizomicrobium sp.]
MKYSYLYLLPACIALSGCGTEWFASRETNPSIEQVVKDDTGREVMVFATTAQRRVVVAKLGGDGAGDFCAEPPPDTAENIASSIAAQISAKDNLNDNAQGALANSFTSAVQSLSRRSQGVIFFRDGMFNLCQEALNGTLKEANFDGEYEKLLDKSAALIEHELDLTHGTIGPLSSGAGQIASPSATAAINAAATAAQTAVQQTGGNSQQAQDAANTATTVATQALQSGVSPAAAAQLGGSAGAQSAGAAAAAVAGQAAASAAIAGQASGAASAATQAAAAVSKNLKNGPPKQP